MALWGSNDDAANSTIFAAAQVNKTPNSTERTRLFGNTTSDAYITGATIGQFGIDVNEQQQSTQSATERPAHAGWVLRREGSGGRSGRVHYETLVAMGSLGGDASNTILPQQQIVISSQPVNNTSTGGAGVTYTVIADTVPSGGTLTYNWKVNGSNITALTANGFAGYTTATLTVATPQSSVNNKTFTVVINTTGGATEVTSSGATIKLL